MFESLVGPERSERDPMLEVPSASTIKLPLMVEVLRQESQGRLSLTQRHTVRRELVVGGTGVLQRQVGRTFTTRELLEITLTRSDNTGGNMLIDLVGLESVNRTMQELGFARTRLARKFLDLEAQRRGLENVTSAGDMAGLLRRIYQNDLISQSASAEMLRILQLRGRQPDPTLNYLGRRLTQRPLIAHLNGTLPGIRCDAGIIEVDGKPYVLAVFLRGQTNESAAEEAIARLSAQVLTAVLGTR
ncbi:MAG: serine hydrolase [Chloroflexi bacterium]|nr:serine hydrolase [Chloroflexota bacterium]